MSRLGSPCQSRQPSDLVHPVDRPAGCRVDKTVESSAWPPLMAACGRRWPGSLPAVIRLVSWNMAHRRAAWAGLEGLDADVGLLQEAGRRDPQGAPAVSPSATDGWDTTGV